MTNIMGRFNSGAKRKVLLLAHYDTRPWADNEEDPAKHNTPIDGANDGDLLCQFGGLLARYK